MQATFTFAIQIQPRNGQQLNELPRGLCADFRSWNLNDFDSFPQATKGLAADEVLVVDKSDNLVYAVAIAEAIEAGVAGDVVEVVEGQFVRAECF